MQTTDPGSLLALFAASEQSGRLVLWSGTGRHAGHISVLLERGRPTTCEVHLPGKHPLVMHPEQGLALLNRQEVLEWEWESASLLPLQEHKQRLPASPSAREKLAHAERQNSMVWNTHDRPCRLRIRASLPPTWTRLHRMTFALIDGQKTVHDIAVLLHKSEEELRSILNECARSGWIGKTH